MSNYKRRVISGALVILYLLTGLSAPAWFPGITTNTFAEASSAPDLIIESVSYSPEAPSIGSTLTFTVTIRNLGDISAGPSLLTSTIDEHHLAASPVEIIYPGAAVIITLTWKVQAGPHVFQAVIDSNGSVPESDEGNNGKTYAFSILAPDLAIDAISWTPVNPATGDSVSFTVTIINQGDKRAGFSHLDFFIDDNSRGYHTIPGMEAGASVNDTFTWTATPGLHNLKAVADVMSQVKESDEANNNAEATCATIQPDFTINTIIISPENISEDTAVTFSVIIINQGGSRAGLADVTFYMDDSRQDSVFLGSLGAGAMTTANFTWVAESGSHTFKAIIDAYNHVEESDETNNSRTVSMAPLAPDLVIQDITWSPSSPVINRPVTFTITVKNQGKNTAGFAEIKLYIDGIYVFSGLIPELPVNAANTAVFSWMPQSYSHTLKASVDETNYVIESNESNNIMTKTVTSALQTPSADLILEKITCSPSKPVIGETVTVTLHVKNQGTGTASPSYAAVHLNDSLIDTVYIKELKAGSTHTKDLTLPLQGLPFKDTYKISALLDCNDTVWETDELNNRAETSFSTYAPDLAIQVIRWSPEIPAIGDGITFDVTVKNHGDLKAGSTNISYYVDNVFMGRHRIEEIPAGTTVTRSFTWVTQTGSYSFTAVIDEDCNIKESDESNNTRTVDLPAPDLFIDSITWPPENAIEFSPVTFTADIGNRGYGRSTGALLSYYIDGAAPLTLDTNEINPGGTVTVIFTHAFLSGEHAIRLIADSNDAISESDEANNEKTVRFFVKSSPASTSPPVPESTDNTTSQLPAPESPVTVQVSENLTSLNQTLAQSPVPDIAANITTSPPKWQGILQNSWLIAGIAALGIAAIGALLFFRKKQKKS